MFEIRAIIPSEPAVNPEALLQAVDRVLDESAQAVQIELIEPTTEWNHKVKAEIGAEKWLRRIYVEDEIYTYVNDGVEPHEILPVRAHALRFYTGGIAKTAVGSLGSRPGAEGDNLVFAKSAMNPGIMAREFDRVIAERWDDILPERVQAAIDRVNS